MPIFGYQIAFTEHEQQTGRFKPLVDQHALLRAIDFSLPSSATDVLWNGYARRQINAYVPKVSDKDLNEEAAGKYQQADEAFRLGELKTLNHLACADKKLNEHGRWKGQTALMTLKGDVDNLGMIFQRGLGAPSFAKMAALSRQMNAFFALYLPWLCQQSYPDVYTVFAGGDDFFLIGPWHSTMKLAAQMQQDFSAYVANNPEVHFSSGLCMTKPGLPIRYLADSGEEALEHAKGYQNPRTRAEKNAVSCFSEVMSWADFHKLLSQSERLSAQREQLQLSTGYLYGLLNLVDKREKLDQGEYQHAIWRSYFSYRTYRMLEGKKLSLEARRKQHEILSDEIAEQGIEKHKGNYRVTLFSHLYQQRD